MKKSLLIGIGNSGRQDDGLGWAFVEQVEQEACFQGDCLYRFQLNIEDAELLSQYDQVFFADAFAGELPGGFALTPCHPQPDTAFSTHLLSPACTLYLCRQLYAQAPQAWLLTMQGYRWELKEGLSAKAQANLEKALKYFRTSCRESGELASFSSSQQS
ncbi:hydrogenase maturation protease [Botryobacter ruber]|uniref:hydrogenase maturation protease n=1 Tax=Botryobacter ruber TaxID=2171629 RepID=UPI000E0C9FE1|nr:hydrogenase maturation protease [Botryobacter ruber]